jgi:lysophospholipase L1-like esterase
MRFAHLLAFVAGAAVFSSTLLLSAQVAPNSHDHQLATDFGQLARYQAANQQLPPSSATEPRVIFYGDSITDAWKLDQYFPGKGYLDRGISGQTTPQMLVRFRQDVIDLQPKVLIILAGTNDLAGNTGPETVEQIEANYATLAELARVHHIALVYSSVMPVSDYVHPDMTHGRPPEKILALNAWLKQYCRDNNLIYLDYFAAMVDPSGQLQKPLSPDGLHPNDAGYRVMAPLARQAITAALAQTGLAPQ